MIVYQGLLEEGDNLIYEASSEQQLKLIILNQPNVSGSFNTNEVLQALTNYNIYIIRGDVKTLMLIENVVTTSNDVLHLPIKLGFADRLLIELDYNSTIKSDAIITVLMEG